MSRVKEPANYSCPVFAYSGRCGEQDALSVMEQFKNFYESKLHEVDLQGAGDCSEVIQEEYWDDFENVIKLKIQRRWIEDLTEQTQMMARIVKELEDEATTRVRMLEDKLKQSSKSTYEVMKRYQTYSISCNLDEPFQKIFYLENDVKNLVEFVRRVRDDQKWSIEGLKFYDVTHKDLFGNERQNNENKDTVTLPIPSNATHKESPQKSILENSEESCHIKLKRQAEEYENLKQSMLDMRTALTEEVACKHDAISALKKDVQQLEDRCLQADKQTAFKDDIIKELRKEIKQLKKEGNDKGVALEQQVKNLEGRLKTMRPSVKTESKFTMMDISQNAIQKDLENENLRRKTEVDQLQCRCDELELALRNSQERAENLQKAVDLYSNSVNMLEAVEEKYKIEIEQQRTTIVNLQEALVSVKHDLDECRQKAQQDIQYHQFLAEILYVNVVDFECQNKNLNSKIAQLSDSYQKLQECNLELEVDHFNCLQDLAMLETQLCKYQSEFKEFEAEKVTNAEVKKLRHQNRYYEHIVESFKHEMAVMSEQLTHLQDILSLSNQSCREENGQLHSALVEVQTLCEKLQNDLLVTERKMLFQNQKNQEKDAKIGELQSIIGQKNVDLNFHGATIHEMKVRLENEVLQNHELRQTVVSLNTTILHLKSERGDVSSYLTSPSHDLKEDLDRTTKTLAILQAEYKTQHNFVKQMQVDVDRIKEKNKEKLKVLRQKNEELKNRLVSSEHSNERLVREIAELKEHMHLLADKDMCREHQLAQSKQIIEELRQTLFELNEGFTECELNHVALIEELKKERLKDNKQQENDFLNCRCEIVLYKKLAENLKDALIVAKKKLIHLDDENRKLVEELKRNECKMQDICKRSVKKEKENSQCICELKEKLQESQNEEKRLADFIDTLQKEVDNKLNAPELTNQSERDSHKRKLNPTTGLCECCDCTEMSTTQEEIITLKLDIKNMIQNQLALNSENDKLLSEVTGLRSTITLLEEKNRCLKQKLTKIEKENKKLIEKNLTLASDKDHTLQSLEMELTDVKKNRDDICAESKCVVKNVQAWLEEQRKINDRVKKKGQCFCETIRKLKDENQDVLQAQPVCPKIQINRKKGCKSPPIDTFRDCGSPWGLGSQGMDSVSPRDSPSSFISCSVEEWYAPNYKEEETTDDEFINRLEAITQKMKKNNEKWNRKCNFDGCQA